MFAQSRRHSSLFFWTVLLMSKGWHYETLVTKFRHFRLEAYGDDNLNCETNVVVVLAGHEFIKNPEIF